MAPAKVAKGKKGKLKEPPKEITETASDHPNHSATATTNDNTLSATLNDPAHHITTTPVSFARAPTIVPFDVQKLLRLRAAGRHNPISKPRQVLGETLKVAYTTGAILGSPASAVIIPTPTIAIPDIANSFTLSSLSKTPVTVRTHKKKVARMPATLQFNETYNLSMTSITDANMSSIIKSCMKNHIFRKCKFYNRDKHGVFSTKANTMCGQVIKHCNINGADGLWWHKMRRLVVKTHTDHRNNCIKAMQTRFKGT
jgi:hypothetical protein